MSAPEAEGERDTLDTASETASETARKLTIVKRAETARATKPRSFPTGGTANVLNQLSQSGEKLAILLFLTQPGATASVGVTSPLGREGKTSLAEATALALARAGETQTALVDCDWRQPSLHAHFDLPAAPGLADWLRGECDATAIQHQVSEHLIVVPAGDSRQEELRLAHLLRDRTLRDLCPSGYIIADLPSVLTTGYAQLVAAAVEALLVVAHAGVTSIDQITETYETLGELDIRGVALNQMRRKVPRWLERMF